MNRAPYLAAVLFTAFGTNASAQPHAANAAPVEGRVIHATVDAQSKAWCRVAFVDSAKGPDTVILTKGHLRPGQKAPSSTDPGEGRPSRLTIREGMSQADAKSLGQMACNIAVPTAVASAPTSSF